ncbi:uncharacterized protein LOC123536868 [Mercenaria mercenaria]|uniref:uncharacterized protein LOC123536868 n=1 Tax=Mercenaria mercenaria TaxID=6596 RepID=UPI00234F316A|nr:uncharacterized protein LOC123536868 [Mercenaria mercenaria]XP_045176291.2 uncharacterized protein LOC123536868 [Mercenaria mercenaria]
MSNSTSLNDHHRDILEYLNEERKKQSLCDIKLVASGTVVHAHKSVLAAECEYFRILFHCQFSDSNKHEIDLTATVDNADDLEKVINFIYTCEIEITEQNLPELVRIASFFLMKNLLIKIRDYMMKEITSDTCLQYYLLATEGALPEVEGMASLMLKAKFHNYHINMDETLAITPDDLKDFHEKGFFNFCEIKQFLDFITKWVGRHHTETHITVACHVISAFVKSKNISRKSSVTKRQVTKSFTVMLSNLKDAGLTPADNIMVAEFVETFKKALADEAKSVPKRKGRRRKSRKPANKKQKEMVLVALGKTKEDDDDDENIDDSDDCEESYRPYVGKPLHVCIYVPSSQCWFSYCTVPVESIAFTSDFVEEKIGEFFMFRDYFVSYSYDDHCLLFHHTKRKPGSTAVKDIRVNLHNYFGPEDSFSTVHNDTFYVVNRVSCKFDLNAKTHLIGFRLDDEMNIAKLFETEPLPGSVGHDKDHDPVRDMEIRISSKTNEMLIIHSTFDTDLSPSSAIYLVKLGEINCTVTMLLNTKDEEKILRECHIVEMDDRFLVVREDNDRTHVICEYIFLSDEINFDTEYIPGETLYDSYGTYLYPSIVPLNGTHRFWQFEVYPRKLSILKSADFNEKKITVTEHVAPPLSKILSFHETWLPVSFLKKLKKVP